MARYTFTVRLSHSRHLAGLYRRSPNVPLVGFVVLVAAGVLASLPLATEPQETTPIHPPPVSFGNAFGARLYDMLLRGINTHVIWAGDTWGKAIALTFDDGPNAKYTPQPSTLGGTDPCLLIWIDPPF